MENMVNRELDIFDNFFEGKRVLVTGHTGFKGSWLCIWLHELGAEVVGVSKDPYTDRDNYVLSSLKDKIVDLRGDITDGVQMKEIFMKYQPEIVFHLAAQPLVRLSYEIPVETYQTNVMGTINIMEAMRATDSVMVGVMITTDKCYENKEQIWGYRENEPMGGYDPYSSSKGAAEIAISSWRRSFFNPDDYGTKHHVSIASVRAGNVIGGGDWALDRIIPDCIRALEADRTIEIRSPKAIRPWQHVLEPLSGYMLLASKMWMEPTKYCEGWNFGPNAESVADVWTVASEVVKDYCKGELKDVSDPKALHEAKLLMLDISKAKFRLGWTPRMNIKECIDLTVEWYKRYSGADCFDLCVSQIKHFIADSKN
jgi:CDP-glucose 4,6-dehydratase